MRGPAGSARRRSSSARRSGATVIATAGGPEKVAFCRELGADVAIDYRDGGFADAVLDATFGAGVDVALDCVGGSVTTETFRCMGMHGRQLIVGYAEDITNDGAPILMQPAIYGNFSLLGVCLAYTTDPLALRLTARAELAFAQRGPAGAPPHSRADAGTARFARSSPSEISFDELPAAMERQERRETMGRTVVRLGRTPLDPADRA